MSALHEWKGTQDPPPLVWRTVRDWVGRLGTTPWQAPSVPFPALSEPRLFEVRIAVLFPPTESGFSETRVLYKREFDGEFIDLLWVRSV